MNKTILNQRVTVIPYHFEDFPESFVILRDEETGSVCVETGGDPFFCDSWDEMLDSPDWGMENAVLGPGMWLEQYLTDKRGIPAERLEKPEWLEAEEDGLLEELEHDFGTGEALWLANL